MSDQVYISKHSYYTKWYAATVCVCVAYYATRCGDLAERLGAFKKHARVSRAHNVEHCGEETREIMGESRSRVGSWKVRGTERGENIQFNFETAPAQSTNTKASLQADPC